MHSVTDRQTDRRTDGRHDDANSQSYSVAVRSAKNRLRPRDRPTFLTMTHMQLHLRESLHFDYTENNNIAKRRNIAYKRDRGN